jgi:hypothetical protein
VDLNVLRFGNCGEMWFDLSILFAGVYVTSS